MMLDAIQPLPGPQDAGPTYAAIKQEGLKTPELRRELVILACPQHQAEGPLRILVASCNRDTSQEHQSRHYWQCL